MAHWPDREPAELGPKAIMIDKRSKLSPQETMGRYLVGEGTPVVVTDAQENWRARKLWSLDYFKKHYANEELIASDRAPLRHEDNPRMQTLRTTLGEYIDYMQNPGHGPIAQQERDAPFYGNSWSPFIEHEAMRGHITRPYFVPDDIPCSMGCPIDVPCTAAETGHERLDRSFTKIFLGPAGTVTRLHNDTYYTHAWLSQVRGTKQFILYPPSQRHLIHAGENINEGVEDHGASQTWFDPLAPDYDQFPRAREATPYVAVCGPGETILVPSLWYHYAVALTPSITCMRNFMNQHNVDGFMHEWNKSQSGGSGGDKKKKSAIPMSPKPYPPPMLPPPKPGWQPPQVQPKAAAAIGMGSGGVGGASARKDVSDGFVAASAFDGAREGMVFKMGPAGLGYYPDTSDVRVRSTGIPMASGVGRYGLVGVTVDHSRTVHRMRSSPSGSQQPGGPPPNAPGVANALLTKLAREAHEGRTAVTAVVAVAPLNAPCGRRVATASQWGEARRAAAPS